jgi:hypothetical protein
MAKTDRTEQLSDSAGGSGFEITYLPELATFNRADRNGDCLLSGVKQPWRGHRGRSLNDPGRVKTPTLAARVETFWRNSAS